MINLCSYYRRCFTCTICVYIKGRKNFIQYYLFFMKYALQKPFRISKSSFDFNIDL